MKIDRDWLRAKIKAEPDDACYDAGVLHPEAPVPALISALTPTSSDLEIMDAIVVIERQPEPFKSIFHAAAQEAARIDAGVYERLRQGATP